VDQTGASQTADQISHDDKVSALRNDIKNSSEKARWFAAVLEPYEESRDMATNMEKHSRFMIAAFRRLNDAQAAKAVTPTQLDALLSVCQPHFDWYTSRATCARNMEKTLCPKTGAVKAKKKGDAESQTPTKAAAAGIVA
jgi:hypothetical protein